MSQPALITKRLGKRFRLAQVSEEPPLLMEGMQRIAQVEAEINRLLARGAIVGEMLKGRQGLLKGLSRLPQGRALDRPGPGLATVGHSFVPHLATHSMVRQPVDLLGQAVGIQPLEGCHNADMQHPPPLLEQAAS